MDKRVRVRARELKVPLDGHLAESALKIFSLYKRDEIKDAYLFYTTSGSIGE